MAAINDENNRTTVDEPPYNEDPGIAAIIFSQVIVKCMPTTTLKQPEHNSPSARHFFKLGFHCKGFPDLI